MKLSESAIVISATSIQMPVGAVGLVSRLIKQLARTYPDYNLYNAKARIYLVKYN